jgi:hypothetical protein
VVKLNPHRSLFAPNPRDKDVRRAGFGIPSGGMTTILDTWTALLAPRRALPIAAVGLPLVYGQSVWTADPERGVMAGVVLCVGTALVAPAAWRLLGGGGALGVARYVAVGLVSVAVLAIWLPRLGDFEDRFLTMPVTLPLLAGVWWTVLLTGLSGLATAPASPVGADEAGVIPWLATAALELSAFGGALVLLLCVRVFDELLLRRDEILAASTLIATDCN